MSRYTDGMMNKFKKTNLFYSDDFLKFQDPTYLGFKLFFLFDQPDSGLLSENEHPNTAYGYLKRIGDEQRAEYIKSFVQLLKRLNSEAPWFFQSIKGLNDAWKHGYNEDEGFKSRIPRDRRITIECLDESIDLRITALMDLYRKGCFDWENRREVVPRNLRQFDISVYVYEARDINRWGFPFRVKSSSMDLIDDNIGNKTKKEYDRLLGEEVTTENLISRIRGATGGISDRIKNEVKNTVNPKESTKDYINPNISRTLFRFSLCEFLPDESGEMFSDISHKELGIKQQQIVFKYSNVIEDNLYRMFHDSPITDSIIESMDRLALDDPTSVQNPILSKLQGDAINRLSSESNRVVSRTADRLFLGNVYGFSTGSLIQTTSQGIGGLGSVAGSLGSSPSINNDNSKNPSGNINENSVSLNNNINIPPSENIIQKSASLNNDSSSSTNISRGNQNASLNND